MPKATDPGDSTAFLRAVLDGVADGVVAVADDGSIRFANRAAVALLGQPALELVGSPFPLPLTAVSERPLPGRPSTVVALRVAQLLENWVDEQWLRPFPSTAEFS